MVWNAKRKITGNGGATSDGTTFLLEPQSSGPSHLPSTITINGTTANAVLRYVADGSGSFINEIGPELSLGGTGAEPVNVADTPFLDGTKATRFFSGGKFLSGSLTDSIISGNGDYVVEIVMKVPSTGIAQHVAVGGKNADNSKNWFCGPSIVGGDDGPTSFIWGIGNDGSANEWVYKIFFFDRAGSIGPYYNTTIDIPTAGMPGVTGSLDAAGGKVYVGVSPNESSYRANSAFAFIQVFYADGDWINSHVQNSLVAERFRKLTGIDATKTKGTSAPNLYSRASGAYLPVRNDSGSIKYHYVGNNWLRLGQLPPSGSHPSASIYTGYLSEEAATQAMFATNNLTSSAWNHLLSRFQKHTASVARPYPDHDVWELCALNGNNQHNASHYITSSTQGTLGAYVKKAPLATNSWVALRGNAGSAIYSCWFNFDTKEFLANPTYGDGGYIELGDDWFYLWYMPQVSTNVFTIYTAPTINTYTYNHTGGDIAQVYVQNPTCLIDDIGAHTYIENTSTTSGSTVTRAADILQYKGDDGNLVSPETASTVDVDFMSLGVARGNYNYLMQASDGGSANETFLVYLDPTGDNAEGQVVSNGAANNSILAPASTDTDSTERQVRLTIDGTALNFYNISADLSASATHGGVPPNDLDEIDIGMSRTSTNQANGLIKKIKIFKKNKGNPL